MTDLRTTVRRLIDLVASHIRTNVGLQTERIWLIGRLLVAFGVFAGTLLLLRRDPILPVYAGLTSFAFAYGIVLLLALRRWPHRLVSVFVVGFLLDNAVLLASWWYFLAVNSGALQTNDMYLAIIPILIVAVMRLGWLAGGIYSAFWIGWLAWSSWYFYGVQSYDVRQLPVRVTFITISVILSMRLVAITARERRLERLRLEELERLERFKSSVVQSISHELRTPLTTIKVCGELITDRLAREGRSEFQRLTQSLNRATTRLERMIEQSTDFARARQSQTPLVVRSVDLEPLVRRTVALFSPELDARQQSVAIDFPDGLPAVEADASSIERVVSIFLDNAIKYSPVGSWIEVRAAGRAGSVRVEVEDQGPGVPQEDRSNVFAGLYRGRQGDRMAAPGAGLSLALARELIERHRGQIGIESSDGKGVAAFFVLPCTRRTRE